MAIQRRIVLDRYPVCKEYIMTRGKALTFPAEENAMEAVMDLIRAIRARRAEMNVPPSKKAEMQIVTAQPEPYRQGLHFIQNFSFASFPSVIRRPLRAFSSSLAMRSRSAARSTSSLRGR